MKISNFFLVFVLLFSLFASGCATNSSGPAINLDRVVLVAKLASYDGTFLYLSRHKDQRPKFELAVKSLDALIVNGVSVAGLVAILDALPIKQLDSTEGRLILDSAVIIFDSYFSSTTVNFNQLEKMQDLKIVVESIKDGINKGLDSTK